MCILVRFAMLAAFVTGCCLSPASLVFEAVWEVFGQTPCHIGVDMGRRWSACKSPRPPAGERLPPMRVICLSQGTPFTLPSWLLAIAVVPVHAVLAAVTLHLRLQPHILIVSL